MRTILISFCVFAAAACSTIGNESRDHSIITPGGLRVDYSKVSTPGELFANGDFGIAVTLVDHGKIRKNPTFVIAKKDMSLEEREDVRSRLWTLINLWQWPARVRHYSQTPERFAELDALENDLFGALIDSAYALEAATTRAERATVLAAIDKRIAEFQAREPNMW